MEKIIFLCFLQCHKNVTFFEHVHGGTLVDAIVAGCSTVEEDRSVTSVGWGGR